MTVAPELPGALDLIAWLHARGVATSMGHSASTLDEARAGYAAGGSSTTHLFNAMSGVDHRSPGLAVAALTDDAVYVELIADGVHVHPAIWPLITRTKPADRLMLVSDAIPLAGMGDGRATVGGLEVEVVGQRVTLVGTSTLAGSVIALDDAVRNLVNAGVSLPTAVAAASRNPLAMLGVTDRGRIAAGQRADLVELDDDAAGPPGDARRDLVRDPPSLTWSAGAGSRCGRSATTSSTTRRACSRHAIGAQRTVEPGLSPAYEEAAATQGRDRRPLPPRTERSGAVAMRGGEIVGYLLGAPRAPLLGPNMWVEGSGHAVAEPEVARDLYGFAAGRWVEEGATSHYALVPATDASARGRLVPSRLRAAAGPRDPRRGGPDETLQATDAGSSSGAPSAATSRPSAVSRSSLGEHQVLSPIFWRIGSRSLEDADQRVGGRLRRPAVHDIRRRARRTRRRRDASAARSRNRRNTTASSNQRTPASSGSPR